MLNVKARFRNKPFLVTFISSMVLFVQLLGFDIFPANFAELINVGLGLLTMAGVILDPSTDGISDVK